MKHLTKIFVGLAIVLFIVGYYLQATDHDSQGIKLLLAAIMFMSNCFTKFGEIFNFRVKCRIQMNSVSSFLYIDDIYSIFLMK